MTPNKSAGDEAALLPPKRHSATVTQYQDKQERKRVFTIEFDETDFIEILRAMPEQEQRVVKELFAMGRFSHVMKALSMIARHAEAPILWKEAK